MSGIGTASILPMQPSHARQPARPACPQAPSLQADRWVDERHRHRFEVNPTLVDQLEAAGLRFVGKDESGQRMEVRHARCLGKE